MKIITVCTFIILSFVLTINAQTNDNTEFLKFWSEFKTFCCNKEKTGFENYIKTPLTVSYISFGETVSENIYDAESLNKTIQDSNSFILPACTMEFNSVGFDNKLSQSFGDSGDISWNLIYSEEKNAYVYYIIKYGPVSWGTYYLFEKTNGSYQLKGIVNEDF